MHEVDGVVLKAIMIAAKDYLRPSAEEAGPCWGSPEAHQYRVIRQENVIFVRIDENLEACGLQYISVDTGAEYAISTEGRILRRIYDGEPRSFSSPSKADAGVPMESPTLVSPDGGVAPLPD